MSASQNTWNSFDPTAGSQFLPCQYPLREPISKQPCSEAAVIELTKRAAQDIGEIGVALEPLEPEQALQDRRGRLGQVQDRVDGLDRALQSRDAFLRTVLLDGVVVLREDDLRVRHPC